MVTGSVAGCSDRTCTEEPVSFAETDDHPIAVQMDADRLYWVNYGTGFSDGGVFSVPR